MFFSISYLVIKTDIRCSKKCRVFLRNEIRSSFIGVILQILRLKGSLIFTRHWREKNHAWDNASIEEKNYEEISFSEFWNHEMTLLCEKCPYSKFLWSIFSRIRTEYGKMRKSKTRIRTLFTQCSVPFI